MNGRSVIFWVLFLTIQAGLFVLGAWLQYSNPKLSNLNNPVGLSIYISRGSGLVLVFDTAVILIPVCRSLISHFRSTILQKVMPVDKSLFLHKQIAYSIIFFSFIHVLGHLFNLLKLMEAKLRDPIQILFTHPAGITGILITLFLYIIASGAHERVRRARFEIFYYTHHLAIPWVLLVSIHGVGCFVKGTDGVCYGYFTYRYATLGLVIYVFEKILRSVRSSKFTYIYKVIEHPEKVMEIQFHKPSLSYESGQYIFINVPEISKFQWHPFTLTSSPEEDYVSVHIKAAGNWTKKLANRLGCFQDNSNNAGGDEIINIDPTTFPKFLVDGPFGTPSEDITKYDVAIMVGAGIGVTPFVSQLKSIWYKLTRNLEQTMKLQKIYFIWICREKDCFEWFYHLLSTMESQIPKGFLEISIFMTGSMNIEDIIYVTMNCDSEVDPITNLREKTTFGRPNFDVILSRVASASTGFASLPLKKAKKCGVFLCGPKNIENSIKHAISDQTENHITFDFHKETF